MLNSIYDDHPEKYHTLRQCWLETHRFQYLKHFIATQTGTSKAVILELGCGTGLQLTALAKNFPGLSFIGIEPNPRYCEFVQGLVLNHNLPNVTVHCALAEDFRLGDHLRPSLVLSNDVLHHIDRWDLLLENLKKHTTSQAHWLAIEPNPLNFYSAFCQMTRKGEKIFQRWQFSRKAQGFGWQIAKVDHLFLWPPAFKKNPSPWLQQIEKTLEKIPFIGGGVALNLRRIN
jgi:SAM-dependent methyltransferase